MLVCALTLVLHQAQVWIGTIYPETHPPVVRDRVEFTKKLLQLRAGMTPSDVERILGKPDDVLGPEYETASYRPCEMIWMYGSTGKDSFATYGSVEFINGKAIGGRGSVDYDPRVYGPTHVDLPESNPMDEAAFILALQKIWRLSRMEFPFEAGQAVPERIVAVNALIALPDEDVRLVVKELERLGTLSSGVRNAWTVVQPLFLSDDPGQIQERERAKWIILSGLPILRESQETLNGWSLVGEFDALAKRHAMRSRPYTPGDLKALFEYGETLWNTELREGALVARQIESLLQDVAQLPQASEYTGFGQWIERARQAIASVGGNALTWQARSGTYGVEGGRFRERTYSYYRTFVWQPGPLEGTMVSVRARRQSPHRSEVALRLIALEGSKVETAPSFEAKIVDPSNGQVIARASFDAEKPRTWSNLTSGVVFIAWKNESTGHFGSGSLTAGIDGNGGLIHDKTISLDSPKRFRLELEAGGKTYVSPILVP